MDTFDVPIPEGVELTVTENPHHTTKQRNGALFGPILSSKRYIMHNCSLVNLKRAIIERVFRVKNKEGKLVEPPRPKSRSYFNRILFPEFCALTGGDKFRPWSTKEVLPLWSGSKLLTYTRAYKTLLVKALTRKDGYLKCFVKCEKIDGSKVDPVPRVIQPRNPRYNLCLARFLKPYEKSYYQRIDKMWDTDGKGDKTVFKGMNARHVADNMILKASRYHKPVFVGLDASRFDQHVSDIALQWEHSIYKSTFSYDIPELSKLLQWQVDNVGYGFTNEGSVSYRVKGRRMSGDVNTSLGNCMLMSSMVHAYMRIKGIPSSLANNGDDCVLIFERKHLHKIDDLNDWFLQMGFNIVREEPLFDIRQVPFCQTNVLTSPGYNVSVRHPEVCVSKDLHSCFPFSHDNQYEQWLSSVGKCGSISSGGIPVLHSFYNAFPNVEITNKTILLEMEREIEYCNIGGANKTTITDEMRHSFWVAFGILPDTQVELEEIYKGLSFGHELGVVKRNPLVSLLQLQTKQ